MGITKTSTTSPIEAISANWPNGEFGFIEFDESLTKENSDFERRHSVTHDGTYLFTLEAISECLLPLVNKQSYFKGTPEEVLTRVKDIKYTVGSISIKSEFGTFDINGTMMMGQNDLVSIPVKCEYTLLGEA